MTGEARAPDPPAQEPAGKQPAGPTARRRRAALIGLLLILLALPPLTLARFARTPGPPAPGPRTVDIPSGAGLGAIASELHEAGIVSNRWLFVLLALSAGAETRLKAGEYEFKPGLTPRQVLEMIEAGRVKPHLVTLQEGWTVAQMAEAIGRLGIVPAASLLALARDPAFARRLGVPGQTLEGYCFPDTYAFTRGMSAEAILKKLVARFREVYAEETAGLDGDGASGLDPYEVVTLASIVEKETGVPGERPLIASVFLNRLHRGMRLQSDPTVIYGIPDFDGNLTREHLARPGPYNTYVRAGLPPGPIANPGREALRAVLRPEPADYLYFVSRNDGSHEFSRTLAEHNRAVHRYQRARSPRPSRPPEAPGT